MKGQIRVEFIFGVVVFAIIIFMMISQVNTIFTSVGRDSMSDTKKVEAISFIDMLVRDSGNPPNWESNPSTTTRLGLAYNNQSFNLSYSKIQALNNTRTAEKRCTLLENYSLGGYRLTIYKNNSLIVECGAQVVTPYLVTVSRPVFINNTYGRISLEVW